MSNGGSVPSQQMLFTRNVPAATGVKINQDCPIGGTIVEVMFSFPPGCNGLVDVMLGHNSKQFSPMSGYLSLDNATPIFRVMREPVAENDSIWCQIVNRDGANPHIINVTVMIEGAA